MDDTHNGWTNRETWSLMLWVNNDQDLHASARGAIASDNASWPYRRAALLRDWAETTFTRAGYVWEYGDDAKWPDKLADIAAEIGSLDRVNYVECVEALTGEA